MKPIFSEGVYYPTYIIGEPIQKGNGIHMVHNGRNTEHRWYPEEALNDNPDINDGMDYPSFAHSGHDLCVLERFWAKIKISKL